MLSRLERWRETRLLDRTFERWQRDEKVRARIDEVLALNPKDVGLEAGTEDERGLPGNAQFRASGWYKHMLNRYLLAMDHARGQRVLDSCCGLGWGSYLVAGAAQEVVGVAYDEQAIAFCREHWPQDNLSFVKGSVLELPFEDASFDIVMCMEAIEHFSVEDGRKYLSELRRVCRPGGKLVGSSAFPRNRGAADALCSENEHHLHVYTRAEMRDALEQFGTPVRLTPHYFAATKA